VFARRRTVYVISCPTPMTPFPLLIDPSGFWIRPEGAKFIAGFSPADDLDDQPLEPDYDSFESHLWPALAQPHSGLRRGQTRGARGAGYFEMNTVDHNAILGPHPSLENFLFMNGFSGHGMPASAGRGPCRRRNSFCLGRFETLDLSDLLFTRITKNRPASRSERDRVAVAEVTRQ